MAKKKNYNKRYESGFDDGVKYEHLMVNCVLDKLKQEGKIDNGIYVEMNKKYNSISQEDFDAWYKEKKSVGESGQNGT